MDTTSQARPRRGLPAIVIVVIVSCSYRMVIQRAVEGVPSAVRTVSM
jgi:hypothetical protein